MPERGFISWLASEPAMLAIAGAAGGVVRWITLRNNWKEGLPALIVGAVCAVYLAPFIEPLIATPLNAVAPDADVTSLAAFITGLGGIGMAGFMIDLISARLTKHGGGNGQR